MNTVAPASGYFEVNRAKIRIDYPETRGEPASDMLREAQAGAYWGVRSHFTVREDAALVVMPTGSGKTAVMALLAFGLVRERLLVVAPTRFIVDQIQREFERFPTLRRAGCLADTVQAPAVKVVRHRLGSLAAWAKLSDSDVVISTPNCAGPGYSGVYAKPPADLFDVVFLDEAHHWPAKTWVDLADAFPEARIVGFTATPYRNDKKQVPAEIAYNYPLGRAIERGIYRKVEFVPVEGLGDKSKRDHAMALRAKELWTDENRLQPAKLLVRSDRIDKTKDLQQIYSSLGLSLKVVTGDQSLKRNEEAVSSARGDPACHGLIEVGMLGEGLDLPLLRIAVLHGPYHSFPVTLQFIGRLCRMTGEHAATAKILAIPEEVERHTRGLYELDANWAQLIPTIADAAVGKELSRRRFVQERWGSAGQKGQVSLHTIRPAFCVSVYRVCAGEPALSSEPDLDEGTRLLHSFPSRDGKSAVFITETLGKPVWSTGDTLLDLRHDLVTYYRVGDLLFESTTSPRIARRVRDAVGGGFLTRLDAKQIEQVASDGRALEYFVVGMRKAAFASTSVPTYKMLAGRRAEDAVRTSDGSFFAVGHLVGRFTWGGGQLVMGISSRSAKVWAAARDHLTEFGRWCEEVAGCLAGPHDGSLRHLSHLKQPELADALPAAPYAAEFGEMFYEHLQHGLRLDLHDKHGQVHRVDAEHWTDLTVVGGSQRTATPCTCRLSLTAGSAKVSILYDSPGGRDVHLPAPPRARNLRREGPGRWTPSRLHARRIPLGVPSLNLPRRW